MARLTFWMPVEMNTQSRIVAAERGISLSALIREATEEMIEREERRLGIARIPTVERRDIPGA